MVPVLLRWWLAPQQYAASRAGTPYCSVHAFAAVAPLNEIVAALNPKALIKASATTNFITLVFMFFSSLRFRYLSDSTKGEINACFGCTTKLLFRKLNSILLGRIAFYRD